MDPVMIVLRTFHILGGALWFGSAFLFAGFFGPAAGELGPAAGPVMSNVVKKRKIAKVHRGPRDHDRHRRLDALAEERAVLRVDR